MMTITETKVADEKDYICRVTYAKTNPTTGDKETTLQTDVATVYVIRKFSLC
jgi:hypothetical protein